MPIYSYKGYDIDSGSSRKGKVEAESERAARQKIKQKNRTIVAEIKEEVAIVSKEDGEGSPRFSFLAVKVGLKDLSIMVRQFATLQQAHVPLDECLRALVSQVENPVLRNTLSAVKDKVSEGKSLADACAGFPGVFNRLYVNMVRAGESSGTLGAVLGRLAEFFEYQINIRGQIVSAMTYPIVMIVASSAVVAYLFVSVVPNLQKVFDNLKVTLPWYTQTLIEISEALQNYWYVIVFVFGTGYFIFKQWVANASGRYKFDKMLLGVPLFGSIILKVSVSRFTKTLSTLLSSGVDLIAALEITKNVVTNEVICEVLEKAKIEVQEGKSLAAVIAKSGRFPGLVTHMIATGEKTGQLEEMLAHVSEAYDAEVERKISSMVSLIEPLMMIVLFAIAGIVVGSMMLPMLSVMNQIR